ncbi:MAG: IS200/IS605 family accessory protein TnpB-related protein, partial [Actinomycetota bacterium]
QKVDNYLHHTSRLIIDVLVANDMGTLVIGKNAQWKTEINLGKQTNQNFVNIPHARLIEMLEYKARLAGIQVILQEESYTSRSSVRFVLKKPRNGGGNSGSNKVIQYGSRSHFNPLLEDNLFVLWVRTLFKSHPAGAVVKASPLR